jgi:hypothetical protein
VTPRPLEPLQTGGLFYRQYDANIIIANAGEPGRHKHAPQSGQWLDLGQEVRFGS